jgi:exopolyphosphatase / guanosine-5'-triphosphate,3'-diphosphate pyrophosphatase
MLQSASFALHLFCLRAAVIVCHARDDVDASAIRLRIDSGTPTVTVAASWAEAHPRALHLLRDEIDAWARSGLAHAPRLVVA